MAMFLVSRDTTRQQTRYARPASTKQRIDSSPRLLFTDTV